MVEGYFAKNHVTLRNQVLSRYPGFFQGLLKSPSKEVKLLANVVSRDPRSNTFQNLKYVKTLSGLSPWDYSSTRIKIELPVQKVPDSDGWRIGLLTNLLKMREDKNVLVEDTTHICAMVDSLCST